MGRLLRSHQQHREHQGEQLMSSNMEIAIEFANKVRAQLRHLTSEQIADLTDGLEADIASSLDDGAEIGSAEKYASDLLSAAGLSDEHDVLNKPNPWSNRIESGISFIKKSTSGLAPAWWVFRAWVLTQILGFFMFHEETGSPASYEWHRRPLQGYIVFLVLLTLSVRIGRANVLKARPVLLLSHVAIALMSIFILFQSPRTPEWFMYESGAYPTTTIGGYSPDCGLHQVPKVTGLEVGDAQRIIDGALLDYTFFSPEYGAINQVPPESVVVGQDPGPGVLLCTNQEIQLSVEWKLPPTTIQPEPIPTSTTTIVKPKATATTKP